MGHDVSLIVPTYQEAKNIRELVMRIAQADFAPRAFELILVDDNSQDGTVEIVNILQKTYPWLKCIVRKRERGLGPAILEGITQAQGPLVVVMDADLSHPPEKVPALLDSLEDETMDFVIGSRFVAGGSTDEAWPLVRKWGSKVAASLAQCVLPMRVHDPLAGFFAVRKARCFAGGALATTSWKMGLEIMVKGRCNRIKEVPIHFANRQQGRSKMDIKVAFGYLWQLAHLLRFVYLGEAQ